jgi:hypothetical protein
MSRKSQPSAQSNEAGGPPRKISAEARRRAQGLLREITRGVKLKKRMKDNLGMTDESAARACSDDIH